MFAVSPSERENGQKKMLKVGFGCIKNAESLARHQWLMPITQATQEAEVRRISV
jgi:hypothetical protein